MGKAKTWFKAKMEEYKDDPEFLHEYISLLEDEIKFFKSTNLDLAKEVMKLTWKLENAKKRPQD